MIDIKAKIIKDRVVYTPRRKNDKKAALRAAYMNKTDNPKLSVCRSPVQLALFSGTSARRPK